MDTLLPDDMRQLLVELVARELMAPAGHLPGRRQMLLGLLRHLSGVDVRVSIERNTPP